MLYFSDLCAEKGTGTLITKCQKATALSRFIILQTSTQSVLNATNMGNLVSINKYLKNE